MSQRPVRHVGGRGGSAIAGWATIGETPVYFRSRKEHRHAEHLEMLRRAGVITSWEHEPRRFRFPVQSGTTSYLPDFRVVYPCGKVEWHEVKGWLDDKSRVALERMGRHYPEEVILVNGLPVAQAIALAKSQAAARAERKAARTRCG